MKFKRPLQLIFLSVFSCALFDVINAQDGENEPIKNKVEECILLPGFFFCTPELQLDQPVQAMRSTGHCCKEAKISEGYSPDNVALCTPSDNPLRGI